MKNVLVIAFILVLSGCSSKPPKARVQNNAKDTTNVLFKAAGGGTVSINSVGPGTTSPLSEISKGGNTVISETKSIDDTDAITCATAKEYTAVVDSIGKLTVRESNQ
jgi:PBP1b-binding outer membrane lipoprotein LpoB